MPGPGVAHQFAVSGDDGVAECPADIVGIRNGPREGKGKSDLCRCDGILPLRRRFGSEDPQRWSEDEVALKVERVMDGSVHIQKALGGSS